jgi:hypothetical protein
VDVTSGQQWPMYAWAAAVAVAAVAALWVATRRREIRPALPLEHVAAAALIGYFGWEMLVNFPGSVMGYWSLTAGLGDARGVEAQQAFVIAQGVYVAGASSAVVGILRRRTWGIVLGIGLAAALTVWTALNTVWLFVSFGESMSPDSYLGIVTSTIGLGVVPALVAIGLLAWPLARHTTARPTTPSSGRDWTGSTAPDGTH